VAQIKGKKYTGTQFLHLAHCIKKRHFCVCV